MDISFLGRFLENLILGSRLKGHFIFTVKQFFLTELSLKLLVIQDSPLNLLNTPSFFSALQ